MTHSPAKDNRKVDIYHSDLEILNDLVRKSDDTRTKISSLLITIYGAAVSGLFLILANNDLALNNTEKFAFICTTFSAALIVFSALIEKTTDYLAHTQVAEMHVNNIKNNQTMANIGNPVRLSPKPITTKILKIIPLIQICLICVNAASVAIYAYIRIY